MPKKPKIDYDSQHFGRIEDYAKLINKIYLDAINEASSVGVSVTLKDSSKPFSFDDYPKAKDRVDKLINSMTSRMAQVITEATKKEWIEACIKKDSLVSLMTQNIKLSEETIKQYSSRNLEALQAFQNQKTDGLGLSDKIWKYNNQFKGEIELGLDIGIGEGKSAAELSRDLRSYLVDPDKLFRRVRDKHGNLQLSKNAKKYSPGTGVYRSSYKNAMRVTRTQINMAYRESDYVKNQQLDFVVGFEVFRSNHYFDCNVCESLKGKYPKTFKWVGWHPQDRCHVEEILASEEEFISHQQKIMSGDSSAVLKSQNEVTELPTNFNDWVKDNKDRIDAAKEKGTLPYFLRDNKFQ